MAANESIHPVILSGGAGTRLWPLSRELYPKQLLPLASERTMIQETARRASGAGFAPPVVLCNDAHRFIIAEQLRQIDLAPAAIALEPVARNTAPAIAAAAVLIAERAPEALMLVLPSDHVVAEEGAFRRAVATAAAAARAGRFVTFGINPTRPETGYGYVKRAGALPGVDGAYAVERFVEKPDAATAARYLAEGVWSWNSGMFVFPAGAMLEELARFEPDLVGAVRAAVATSARDLDFVRLGKDAFAAARAVSIDYALMERTGNAAIVPASLGWSDIGAWSALWEIGAKDGAGNVLHGDVLAEDTRNSYLRSDKVLLAAVGLDDAVVVATQDVVLAAAMNRVQDVKKIVERLKQSGRPEAVSHPIVYRPWGSYQTIDLGARHQVKHIAVKPGHKLSLQKHAHRAEHWVVVSGVATVTRGEDLLTLEANMSTYIPVGCVHRLENTGDEMLHLIEVQSGGYLGEDDIVRLDDVYGRK